MYARKNVHACLLAVDSTVVARQILLCVAVSRTILGCRKLIGARYFNKAYEVMVGPLNATFRSPRDYDGHGTHTLSTAAGGAVPGANIFGYGNGTAKGGSPRARVAAYKVCWPPVNGNECFDADIVAAFDAAIEDGVDVISVSLGGDPVDYFRDGLAIGSFHAVRKGITVACSAGNSGPQLATVSNLSPWMLTVGASTMNRQFPSSLIFDNNKRIQVAFHHPRLLPLFSVNLYLIHICFILISLSFSIFFYMTFGAFVVSHHVSSNHLTQGESLSPKGLPGNNAYPVISSREAKYANASEHKA